MGWYDILRVDCSFFLLLMASATFYTQFKALEEKIDFVRDLPHRLYILAVYDLIRNFQHWNFQIKNLN